MKGIRRLKSPHEHPTGTETNLTERATQVLKELQLLHSPYEGITITTQSLRRDYKYYTVPVLHSIANTTQSLWRDHNYY